MTDRIIDPRAEFLRGQENNVTSQDGEDGLLAVLFDKIGTTNKWCFEVGAANGVYLSNTKVLRDAGWSAVLIEADQQAYNDLKTFQTPKVFCWHKKIASLDLDIILDSCGAPDEPDFGVIDVDGQDYWILESLVRLPRVLLCEYNVGGDEQIPLVGGPGQAGFNEIRELGESKGYTALMKMNCNVLFCKSGILDN